MPHVRPYLFFSLLILFIASMHAQEKKRLSFAQSMSGAEPKLILPLPVITGWTDDAHYLETRKKEGGDKAKVYSVDASTGAEVLFRDLQQYKELVGAEIDPGSPSSANAEYTRLIYTRENDLYFLDTRTRQFKRLTQTASEEKNPTLSPDANTVAFTRDNNLFSVDLNTGKEIQYTTDGSDLITNGWASWVYYEEILGRPSRYRAFWWSPDGKKIAFYRFDDTKVPVFPIFDANGIHGSLENTRYPKPGDPNPEVRFGIVPATGGPVVWADFNQKEDQYFGMPFWSPDGKQILVQWMNRGQDTLKIFAVDPSTGKRRETYVEHQASWVEWFESLTFLEKNEGFILKTGKEGWYHLYLYGMDGRLKNRITEGKWSVEDLVSVDEQNDLLYFTAKREASTRTDFYRTKLNGTGLTRLTFGEFTHTILLSPKRSFFITTYSNAATPSRMALCRSDGTVLREIADSKAKDFDSYALGKTEMVTIRTPDGYPLPAIWTLPTDFQEGKKYPVIITVYGGPNSATVADRWQGLDRQWLAMEGAIQISVDHRGSGHFGKEGVALMHRNLGKWEMNDYIEAVKWLRAKPFVDSTRICITGGSYGGYSTCMALTAGADYFTHGIAEFSVTDWQLYDSHYVERFMDSPTENPEGYKNASVLTYAGKYKGILRIVHGTMDDNVHMQHSIRLIDKLQDLNKHFEFMVYPGGRHGWRGPKALHLRNENYRFYYRYLLGKEFPVELFKAGMGPRRFR